MIVLASFVLIIFNAMATAQSSDLNSSNGSVKEAEENFLNQIAAGENYSDAVKKYYEKILEADSTNYDALTNLGVIYQQKNDLEKSHGYFEKAVKYHPTRARAYHNLGILNSIIGNLDEVVVNLNKAAELDSKSPNSVRQLGIIYLQNEKPNEAIESFNRALRRDNKDTESYLGKSLAYWLLKDFENVLSVIRLDDAGKVNPKKYLYTIDEGSSMVRNTIVSLNDIVLVDHKKIKVVEKHEVTYIVK